MTTRQFALQLTISLLVGQLVALAVYFIWNERFFVPMVFGSIGAMFGSWFQQRGKRKGSGT